MEPDVEDGPADNFEKEAEKLGLRPMVYALPVFAFYILYEVASILTFQYQDARLTPTSKELTTWVANYNKRCGQLDMTYSLQNACLNGCAYFTLPVVFYITTLYRSRILPYLVKNHEEI